VLCVTAASEVRTLPYGEWPSPIEATDVARAGLLPNFPTVVGDELWWGEMRPTEDGRYAVVRRRADGGIEDVLPGPWSARTRVHEYGGKAWLPVPATDGGGETALVFVSWTDQRVYLVPAGGEPAPLTPEPPQPAGLRYAAPVLGPGGAEVWFVRERHQSGRVTREIVAVPMDGSGAAAPDGVRVVVGGSDFLAHPRVSPDGRRVAWLAWDHPNMPWDGTELRVADLVDGAAGPASTLLGGPDESVLQPEWVDDGHLYAVSDRTGWWNLYRVDAGSGEVAPLCPRDEEFGFPMWLLGLTSYAVLGDGRIATLHGSGRVALGVLDPATGELTDLDLPYPSYRPYLHAEGSRVAALAGSETEPLTVIEADVGSGRWERVRASDEAVPDPAYLPRARSVALPGPDGRTVHAQVWAPHNAGVHGPEGERPPYVVFVHGGPTAAAPVELDLKIAYFTSRGIGVVDVNYGGSSGYGRAYRNLLRGEWGVVDVRDCVAAVQALVDRGDADGRRLAIRGGSAGGWTTLSALTDTDVFAAGTSRFGVAELLRFAADTHDFESRYLDRLVGPLPECRDLYVERAPLSKVDRLSCPVLLLQGGDDPVVPPSQSRMFRDALARKGIPHAYLEFEGETHGFRKVSSIVASYQAELSFYGQVMGFDPPGVPRLELSTGDAGQSQP
jgi:acetyl esterase/lipase